MKRWLLLFLLLASAGCDQNMVQQPRYDPYEAAELFDRGMVFRHPPQGTIAREDLIRMRAAKQPPMTLALLERGRERYAIYCIVCHGPEGRGDGPVVERGFPHPPSLLEPRLRDAPAAHFYDVISNGYGIMYSYADRVSPQDRWAMAGYIRVLQEASDAPVGDHAR
ncbi:c-type cytochrome [Novosphingobium sp. M1R2S20]|uniref:Cytochrome c n=1 Tax=Novosphingobium rhizovicinum TaxID=3228928 RepID=A0ABV3RG74_9SPHN